MEMEPVTSRNLSAVGYDEETAKLRVKFNHGGTWEYSNVPPKVHETLMKSESPGSYFATAIKGHYSGEKV